jgi:DNA ligase (NAD+)
MIAYKHPVEIAKTKLLNVFPTIEEQVQFVIRQNTKPIQIAGTTANATTLHNSEYIKEINVNEGDTVKIN